jgi:hypothetical protein
MTLRRRSSNQNRATRLSQQATVSGGGTIEAMTSSSYRAGPIYIALALTLSLAIAACGPKTVKVPDVSGKGLDEAISMLTKANLSVGSVSEAYHETALEGTVISQSPTPDDRVEAGTTINLTVSKGPQPEMVKVPSLIGMTGREAFQVLQSMNLQGGSLTSASPQPKDTVISQTPEPGSLVPEGSRVMLIVSLGPDASYTYLKKLACKVNSTYKGPVTLVIKVEDDRGLVTVYENQHHDGDVVETEALIYGACRVVIYDARGPKGHWTYASGILDEW